MFAVIGEIGGISIHALRKEGDVPHALPFGKSVISIHALRKEGDKDPACLVAFADQFQSTPSARRATGFNPGMHRILRISIHALRKEGDRP